MSINSNDNIRKIAKLTTRELPHLVQKRENNYAKIMAYTVLPRIVFLETSSDTHHTTLQIISKNKNFTLFWLFI